MNTLTKWVVGPVVAFALLTVSESQQASAGHGVRVNVGGFGISFGNSHRGHRYHGHHGRHRSHYYGHSSHRPYTSHYRGHGARVHYGRGYYHDTSHYDYHRPTVVRHGNHYDYIPGHYDYHRTGHWHH